MEFTDAEGNPERQPSWLHVASPDTADVLEDGIHRRRRHPERQPSWLPVTSPDFAAVLEDGIQKNGWHPRGVPMAGRKHERAPARGADA